MTPTVTITLEPNLWSEVAERLEAKEYPEDEHGMPHYLVNGVRYLLSYRPESEGDPSRTPRCSEELAKELGIGRHPLSLDGYLKLRAHHRANPTKAEDK